MKRYTIIYRTSLRRGTSTRGRCLCSLLLSAPGMNYYYSETQLLHTRMHAFDLLRCSAAQTMRPCGSRPERRRALQSIRGISLVNLHCWQKYIDGERNQKRSCFAKRPFPRCPRRRHEPCILKRSDSWTRTIGGSSLWFEAAEETLNWTLQSQDLKWKQIRQLLPKKQKSHGHGMAPFPISASGRRWIGRTGSLSKV
jgi:hypothetical protein